MKNVKVPVSGNSYISERILFEEEKMMRLEIEPYSYRMEIAGETVTDVSWDGYIIEVAVDGETSIFDRKEKLLLHEGATEKTYRGVCVKLLNGDLAIEYGKIEWIDNYPNCDGEHDRWDEKWVTYYTVKYV